MAPHEATAGFDLAVEEYERGRPSYPAEAVDLLTEECRIRPSAAVVELGAGTGKLTRLLHRRAGPWIAVEPSAPMRALLAEAVPGINVVDGYAESIPLPDSSADTVVVAQAFHWFRPSESLAEIHRVLRTGGRLGLVWNRRDLEAAEWLVALQRIIERYRGDAPSYLDGAWHRPFQTTTLFTKLQRRTVPYEQGMDADLLVDRVLSISFIARLGEDEKARVADEVRAVVAGEEAFFTVPHLTDVFWCARR